MLGGSYSKQIAYNALLQFTSCYVSLFNEYTTDRLKSIPEVFSTTLFKVSNYTKETLPVPGYTDVILKNIWYKKWYIFSTELAWNPQLAILILIKIYPVSFSHYVIEEKKADIFC